MVQSTRNRNKHTECLLHNLCIGDALVRTFYWKPIYWNCFIHNKKKIIIGLRAIFRQIKALILPLFGLRIKKIFFVVLPKQTQRRIVWAPNMLFKYSRWLFDWIDSNFVGWPMNVVSLFYYFIKQRYLGERTYAYTVNIHTIESFRLVL